MRPRYLLLVAALCCASHAAENPGFSQVRAMAHIRFLAGLGSRSAGTAGESLAVRYVERQMREAGFDVRVEPFRFRRFQLDSASLRIGNMTVEPASIGLDPYEGATTIRAAAVLVPAATVNGEQGLDGLDLAGKLVVTTKPAFLHRIGYRQPAAIAYVADSDFERLKAQSAGSAELVFKGRVVELESCNLVATMRETKSDREIIVSAHIDSAGTPGAQDNASGVAVLLELARSLPALKLAGRVRFVFFGAEEDGLLGSRAYLDKHQEDLQHCELLYNVDSVGGKDIWLDMLGGVRNVSEQKAVSRQPRERFRRSGYDPQGRWILLDPRETEQASNVPPWLKTAILDAVAELGYEVHQGQGAGSDHQTFNGAGIVATNIAIGGIKSHVPEDVPGQIVPASLEKAARIVAGVLVRVR